MKYTWSIYLIFQWSRAIIWEMFSSATFELAVNDHIVHLKLRARFWPFPRKRCRQRKLQVELVWLRSGSCLWNVRVHKNVSWTCRGPNHSLSLRRQEHFGLHESRVYKKENTHTHTLIIYIKRNILSVTVCICIPSQIKNSLQSGKTTKYFLCKSFLCFEKKNNTLH